MKTIKEAAESAAKEVFPQLCTGLSEDTVEFYKARDVIARHFADYAALRDAAERAIQELSGAIDTKKPYTAIANTITDLRGLLNTQPTKET